MTAQHRAAARTALQRTVLASSVHGPPHHCRPMMAAVVREAARKPLCLVGGIRTVWSIGLSLGGWRGRGVFHPPNITADFS